MTDRARHDGWLRALSDASCVTATLGNGRVFTLLLSARRLACKRSVFTVTFERLDQVLASAFVDDLIKTSLKDISNDLAVLACRNTLRRTGSHQRRSARRDRNNTSE